MLKKMKPFAAAAMAIALLLIPILPALSEGAENDDDQPTPAYWRSTEITYGTVIAEIKVNVRSGPSTETNVVGRVDPGAVVKVLDTSNEEWYKISAGDAVGYVLASLLETETVTDQIEVIREDPLEVTLEDPTLPDILKRRESFTLRGTLITNVPMASVEVTIDDLRTNENAATATRTFEREEDMRAFDLAILDSELPFSRLSAGEKKLTIFVSSASDSMTVLEHNFYIGGQTGASTSMTQSCTVSATSGRAPYVADNNYTTAWYAENDLDTLTIDLPEGRTGALVTLEWLAAPTSFNLVLRDEANHTTQTFNETGEGGMIAFSYDLDETTRQIAIATSDVNAGLAEVRVYEKGAVSPVTPRWTALPDKVDMMIFAAHEDDEFLYYGGTIPYYAAKGRTIAVVYMADGGRERAGEALEALWTAGVKYHPIFMGFEESNGHSYETLVARWGLDIAEEKVVELIRKYKPEVVVAPDIEGEGGDNLRKLTSYIVRRAVMVAADEDAWPASCEQYGLWDTRKTYVHLYEGNALHMDVYGEPCEELGGATPHAVASAAFAKYNSQQRASSFDRLTSNYDSRAYGLIRTNRGDDRFKNDLMENID